jgi:hypothetical protein
MPLAGLADRAGRPPCQAAAGQACSPLRARPAQAHTLGMVDAHGLHHCVLEAARDLRAARALYAFEPVDWPLLVRQLNADVGAANRFLPDNLQARPTPPSCPASAPAPSVRAGSPLACSAAGLHSWRHRHTCASASAASVWLHSCTPTLQPATDRTASCCPTLP